MLDDLGATLSAVLRERLPAGTTIRLDPPSAAWSGSKATIGLFLHRVLENAAEGLWTEDRDAEGRVLRRTGPERQYDFCYLVTAWDPDREFALLGAVLRAFDGLVPASHLTGSLADARSPVTATIGRPGLPTAEAELWTALALPPRTCLDLIVTAAVLPDTSVEPAQPPHTINLDVSPPLTPPQPAPAQLAAAARPTARITEGGRHGQSGGQAG